MKERKHSSGHDHRQHSRKPSFTELHRSPEQPAKDHLLEQRRSYQHTERIRFEHLASYLRACIVITEGHPHLKPIR